MRFAVTLDVSGRRHETIRFGDTPREVAEASLLGWQKHARLDEGEQDGQDLYSEYVAFTSRMGRECARVVVRPVITEDDELEVQT